MSHKKESIEPIVPANIDEADKLLREIGQAQRKILEVTTEAEAQIDRVKKEAAAKVAVQEARIAERFTGLSQFADQHRDEIVDEPESKTVTLSSGNLFWRTNPPSIKLKNVEKVLEYLEDHGLQGFIRRADPQVDKAAMLKDPERAKVIPGVTIQQDEVFAAKPADGTEEITMALKVKRTVKSAA